MNKKEVKKAPILRFKGFTNDWEQRKLKEVVNINPSTNVPNTFNYVDLNSVKGVSLIKVKKINKKEAPSRAQRVAKNGDIFYQMVRPYQKNNYLFNKPKTSFPYVFSTGYAQLRSIKTSPSYIFPLLQKSDFVNKVLAHSTGTSYPAINSRDLGQIKIYLPNELVEQNKIGEIFQKINKIIELQQRKLKLLKVMKKALSQYMFCQEIEFVPILRFNSFSDKWKYERLKNLIVKEIKGKAKADMKGTKSTYIDTALLNGGSITKVDSPTDTFHNDIIILWDGSQAGKIYHGFTGALGSTLKSYKPKYSGGFLYQYLKSKEPIIFLRYRTPNIPHVVKDFTEIFKINVPSVKEQEKISKILNYLDQSILVETKKIGSIKKIKKFLLQNMFI